MLLFVAAAMLDVALELDRAPYLRVAESLNTAVAQHLFLTLATLSAVGLVWLIRQRARKQFHLGPAFLYGIAFSILYTHAVLTFLAEKISYSTVEKAKLSLVGILMRAPSTPNYYRLVPDMPVSFAWYAGMVVCFIFCSWLGGSFLLRPSTAEA